MRNYIQEWAMGDETEPTKQQVSARIDIEIVAQIEQLADIFGVSKSSIIEGALDVGTRDLLSQINPDFHPDDDARAAYEDAKREAEESKGE